MKKHSILLILIISLFFSCKMDENNILDIVYSYYPKGVLGYTPEHDESRETKKLQNLLKKSPYKKNAAQLEKYLIAEFDEKYIQNMTLFGWNKPCYHLRVEVKDKDNNWDVYVIFISVISDYYYIYTNDDLWQKSKNPNDATWELLDKKVKEFFPEHQPLSSDIAQVKIDDVSVGHNDLGEVHLLYCLFTDHIYYE